MNAITLPTGGSRSHPAAEVGSTMGAFCLIALMLAIPAGLAAAMVAAGGPATAVVDRSGWSELPCLASHTETRHRMDDRPHRQGGRGGSIAYQVTVCDERAAVGPVMPATWRH